MLRWDMILRNSETGEFRYWIPYKNSFLFESPHTVSRRENLTLTLLVLKLQNMDVRAYADRLRPDSKWKVYRITNQVYSVYPTGYPLGIGELPEYIRNHRCIIGLDKDHHCHLYNDQLCAFRCLAKFHSQFRMEEAVDIYFEQWKAFTKATLTNDSFTGLELSQIPDFVLCFQLNINIYDLQPNCAVINRYKSRCHFKDTMYLNLYKHHLSFISNFKGYSQKYQCNFCKRIFNRRNDLKRHETVCINGCRYKFPGGFVKQKQTIFEELKEYGNHVDDRDLLYKYFIVFDFESILEKTYIQTSDKLVWTDKHHAVSVSICSNVPEFENPKCVVNPNVDELVLSMVRIHDPNC